MASKYIWSILAKISTYIVQYFSIFQRYLSWKQYNCNNSHFNKYLHQIDFLIKLKNFPFILVLYDPCGLYAPGETDLTIPEMMPGNLKPEFYQAYHKVRPKAIDHDLQISAQLAFAYPLVYNIPGQDEVTKDEVLDKCKEFVEALKRI